jgi:hypothetical protein
MTGRPVWALLSDDSCRLSARWQALVAATAAWVASCAVIAIALLSTVTAPTASATSAAFTYDVPTLPRVDVQQIEAAEALPTRLADAGERSASPSAESRGATTTPSRSANATNTAGSALEAVAPRVTFGHGARHLEGTGLSATQVESTILQRVTAEASQASTTGSFWGRVRINGRDCRRIW